jgi:hypothetical protein
MKNFLRFTLSILLLVQVSVANAQTINTDFADGVIYAKVRSASADLTAYAKTDRNLGKLVRDYGITEIRVPFKTKNAALQQIYKISFSNWARSMVY